jgi:hypothetical protein
MPFSPSRSLPDFPSYFTLRLHLSDGRRVATASPRNGEILQVYTEDTNGKYIYSSYLQTFRTVSDWIDSVMTIHNQPLQLIGSAPRWWRRDNNALMTTHYAPILLTPTTALVETTKNKEVVLKRMAELLSQKNQITNELTALITQMTA